MLSKHFGSGRQQTYLDLDHCWAGHAPLTLFDYVTCVIYSRSLYATRRHDQACDSNVMTNGKAIEALAGRRPTARWLCLRKLVFVRLPLLPWSWEQLFLDRFTYFFFLFSSSGHCLKNFATDFFYSLPTISGDETKSGYVEKHLFLYVSKYFGRLTFELWNSVATFCR